jgi:hypothetical protein
MTTDRTVLQTRKLLAESDAIMARQKSMCDDMEEARARAEQAAMGVGWWVDRTSLFRDHDQAMGIMETTINVLREQRGAFPLPKR